MKTLTLILAATGSAALVAVAAPNPDFYSVRDFGAVGDGTADDTAAFQKAPRPSRTNHPDFR